VNLIEGPLSWTVWDSHQRRFLGVRDRMGIEELYYAQSGSAIWVSNRIDHLLQQVPHLNRFNSRSLVGYLNARQPLAGETFYDGIQQVRPGHYLVISDQGLQTEPYWKLTPGPMLKLSSDQEYADAFLEIFQKVVGEYTWGDDKAIIALSSGLDSTSLAYFLRSAHPQGTLTALRMIAPDLPQADEDRYSAEVSNLLSLPSLTLRMDLNWPLQSPEGIATHRASPHYHFYANLWDQNYRLAAREDIKVFFTGMFGDALYGSVIPVLADLFLTGHWLGCLDQIRRIGRNFPPSPSIPKIFYWGLLGPILKAYTPGWIQPRPRPVPWLAASQYKTFQENFGYIPENLGFPPGRVQRMKCLANEGPAYATIAQSQRASPYGIRIRHPYMDHRLAEFATCLPSFQTHRDGLNKVIVRRAMRGRLPDSILDAKSKIYPIAVFDRGVREREREKVMRLLTGMRLAESGFVDEGCLQQEYLDYVAGKHRRSGFWKALCVEDWLRRWF